MLWYEEVEPFGELRADWRTAQIVSMVHNAAVKHENQKKVQEFLLSFVPSTESKRVAEAPKKQTVAEQIQILTVLAHAFAGAPRE